MNAAPQRSDPELLNRLIWGELAEEQLRLAAYAGDAGAALVLGSDAPDVPAELEDWVRKLGKIWKKEALVRFVSSTIWVRAVAFLSRISKARICRSAGTIPDFSIRA